MSFNLYSSLRSLFFSDRVQVGTVTAVDSGRVTVILPDGSIQTVRGAGSIGARVYIRGGVIEGPAPSLPVVSIDI